MAVATQADQHVAESRLLLIEKGDDALEKKRE